MNISKILGTKNMYRLLSLFFALLLFFFVNNQRLGSTRVSDKAVSNNTGLTTNKEITLKVPLTLNVDNDKYYVTGYPEQVKVSIAGPSALVTALENTYNFEVYADLSDLKPGTHTVKLKTNGVNKGLNVTMTPEKIKVKIAPKKTARVPIQVRYDIGQLRKGYVAGNPSLSAQIVQVVGARSDINKLDSVVANINLPNDSHSDFTRTVLLQALDKNGELLPVSIKPETVKVSIPIDQATATKDVKLELVTENNGVPGKSYQLETATKTVKLHGTKSALSKLDVLKVPVSVTGVNESTTKTISLSPTQTGISSISPASIEVSITVSDKSKTSGTDEANETITTDHQGIEASSSSNETTAQSQRTNKNDQTAEDDSSNKGSSAESGSSTADKTSEKSSSSSSSSSTTDNTEN